MRTLRLTLALCSCFVLAACGDGGGGSGGGLDPDISDPPPAGDATGDTYSGDWDIEMYWTACTGTCSVQTDFGTISVCDVGDSNSEGALITQTDGDIRMELNDTPSRYDGGVNADGTFDVLGVASQDGGELDIRVRAVGTFTDENTMDAQARSHSTGSYDGQSVNCYGDIEVTGTRG